MGIIRDTIRALFGVKKPKKEVRSEPPKFAPNPKVARVTIQPGKPKPDIPKVNPKVVGVKVTEERRPDPWLDPINPLNPLSPISPLNPLNQADDEPVRHRDHHERVDSTTISDSHHHSTPAHHSSHDYGSSSHHSHDSGSSYSSYDSGSYDSGSSHSSHDSSW